MHGTATLTRRRFLEVIMASCRRVNLIALFLVSVVCLLLLLSTTSNSSNGRNRFNGPTFSADPQQQSYRSKYGSESNKRFLSFDSLSSNAGGEPAVVRLGPPKRISEVLAEQRDAVKAEWTGSLLDKRPVTEFTLETDGQPVRSIVITTWRSGSTFLGDILNTLPGNYYHYEPMMHFEIVQVREEPQASKAVRQLKSLLQCDYSDLNDYLEYNEEHTYTFKHNTRLWRQCLDHPHLCWRPRFLNAFCKLFPLQSMKVVRLRLNIAERLLEDPDLNVRMVLLIRDPRGTLQSRKHRDWCPGHPDCDHAATLCRDMVSDYESARVLSKKYPKRFRVVRYEDLSLEPFEGTKDILQFYGLPFDRSVEDFLDSHTKMDYGGVSSTFRDSKSAPFHWIKDLLYEEINVIQESCIEAMRVWGYKPIVNETMLDMTTFNPLLPYSL